MNKVDDNMLMKNIQDINMQITKAALESGRTRNDIVFVAATKMNNSEIIKRALSTGIIDAAGENRVQELLEKFDENAYQGYPLHFIGHLQTNKVKNIVGKVQLIQSVDSVKLAKEISNCAKQKELIQDILVEINIGDEDTKSGVARHSAYELIENICMMPNLKISVIMAIPPNVTDIKQI